MINNTTNYILYNRSPQYICELNQFTMLNQIEKIPATAYWFLVTAIIILTIYIYIPKIQEKYSLEKIIMPIYLILITSLWFYTFATFKITEEIFKTKVLPPILGIIIIGTIYIIYQNKEKIKGYINREEE